jgi:hypothetical protein
MKSLSETGWCIPVYRFGTSFSSEFHTGTSCQNSDVGILLLNIGHHSSSFAVKYNFTEEGILLTSCIGSITHVVRHQRLALKLQCCGTQRRVTEIEHVFLLHK